MFAFIRTVLITLPNKLNCRSPRELVGDFVSLFGTADPELLDHEGKSFMDRGVRRVVDVHGHSLSLYTGAGTRRHTAHDIIVRKLESILKFAGQLATLGFIEVYITTATGRVGKRKINVLWPVNVLFITHTRHFRAFGGSRTRDLAIFTIFSKKIHHFLQ